MSNNNFVENSDVFDECRHLHMMHVQKFKSCLESPLDSYAEPFKVLNGYFCPYYIGQGYNGLETGSRVPGLNPEPTKKIMLWGQEIELST